MLYHLFIGSALGLLGFTNLARGQEPSNAANANAAPNPQVPALDAGQDSVGAPMVAKMAKEGGAAAEEEDLRRGQAMEAEKLQEASSNTVRRFHEVLDDLLAEFAYDVKMGQIVGLKNLAIRKVTVSDTLPRSYNEYVELLISERVRENSRIRIISCLPCKTKTSRLVEGRLQITSPQTNLAEMVRAADQLGIDYFMDAVLVYHTTHMVLAFQIFNTQTKEMVWARTYNSETIKTRFQKLAVDYSQIGQAPTGEQYIPEYRVLIGLGGASAPNPGGGANDKTFVDLHIRATEKFNNRRNEFGLLFTTLLKSSSILKEYPTEKATAPTETTEPEVTTTADQPKPFTFALGLFALYSYNFLGSLESYNEVRTGFTGGLGALLSAGYLAGMGRVGYDMYFGRRFAMSIAGFYVMPSQILVGGEFQSTAGGAGGELVFALNL
jgi:hypothetical protein